MRKIIIRSIDFTIFILCFLFLLSSFFKLVSLTFVGEYVDEESYVIIGVWVTGAFFALLFTLPLYRWILHLRYPHV